MATVIQGFGTVFLGQRDFWPDGSYLTTEWLVAFFVPLAPLRSLRVRSGPLATALRFPLFSSRRDYAVSDEQPPHLKQVICVYTFTAFYIAWVVIAATAITERFPGILDGPWSTALGMVTVGVVLGAPWLLPLYLRERSKRWRPGFK